MEKLLQELRDLTDAFFIDAEKGLGGNKAAQRRARTTSIEIAKKMKEYRDITLGRK